VQDDGLMSLEVASFVGGLGEVTRMDLEKKTHGNGTCEGLVVPDGTWVLPGIAGEREFPGTFCTGRRMSPTFTCHVARLSVTLRCIAVIASLPSPSRTRSRNTL